MMAQNEPSEQVCMMAENAPSEQANASDLDEDDVEQTKVFSDPVHGHMEFHPLCVAIMDTPEFQRLRFLKQLGGCYYVYPGASHNRFEHSLGVCFLAGKWVKSLQERQPKLLKISKEDILCVQIAGLCHDLGHGPFSHVFEKMYMPKAEPGTNWKHEQASLRMFDYMVENNSNVKKCFEDYNLTDRHKHFIKQLIEGKPPTTETPPSEGLGEWFYPSDNPKAFLYEIVANKRNGVDVDKWDYFKRDSLHLGMSSSFDYMRLIKFARVINAKGQWQICFRGKEAFNIYEMFHTRQVLHRRAYQHKTVQKIELMLADVMLEYDKCLEEKSQEDSTQQPIHTSITNMEAFVKLTDTMFHDILQKGDDKPHLKKAQEILQNIHERKLYKLVGESEPYTKDKTPTMAKKTETDIEEELLKTSKELDAQCFAIQFLKLDFGMKDQDPLEHVQVYPKTNLLETKSLTASEVSYLLPQKTFEERRVRLFFRTSNNQQEDERRIRQLKEAFDTWCSLNIRL